MSIEPYTLIQHLRTIDPEIGWVNGEYHIYTRFLHEATIDKYMNKFPIGLWLKMSSHRNDSTLDIGRTDFHLFIPPNPIENECNLQYTEVIKAIFQIRNHSYGLMDESLTLEGYKAIYNSNITSKSILTLYPKEMTDKLIMTDRSISIPIPNLRYFSEWDEPFPEFMPLTNDYSMNNIVDRLLKYVNGFTEDYHIFWYITPDIPRSIYLKSFSHKVLSKEEYMRRMFPIVYPINGLYPIIDTYTMMWDYFRVDPKRIEMLPECLNNIPNVLIKLIGEYVNYNPNKAIN